MNKRYLLTLSILCLLFSSCSGKSSPEPSDGLIYSYSESKGGYNVSWDQSTNIKNVSIPTSYRDKSVVSILSNGFAGCTTLKTINIPSTISFVGMDAFYMCSNLSSISVDEENTYFSSLDGVLFNKDKTSLICFPIGKGENYQIPNSVATIEASAFYGCSKISSINIPNGVTSIGNNAFFGCSSIKTVIIPDSVSTIGKYAFRECTSLKSITLSNNIDKISEGMFFSCSSLKAFDIQSNIKTIENYSFYLCSSLLKDADDIVSITIPGSVESIGEYAFFGFARLNKVTISEGVENIKDKAFANCKMLTTLSIPKSLKNVGKGIVDDCPNTQSLFTEYNSFYYLGNSSNEYLALIKTKSTSVVSCSVHTNCRFIDFNAFSDCSSLKSITVEDNNKSFVSYDGVLYDYSQQCVIRCPRGKTGELSAISSTVLVEDNAFENCVGLTSISFSDSLISIGHNAFYGCSSLREITIPDSVNYIGQYAFAKCTALNDIHLGNGIDFINDGLFMYCSSLREITIPNNVERIDSSAFHYCSSLQSITLPNTLTRIGSYAFSYCESLESIVIPLSVTAIDSYAFYTCPSITIYCEVDSKPEGWDSRWNPNGRPVVWGY